MNTVYLTADQVPQTMRGSYCGRKFKAIICTSVDIPAGNNTWDGGSKDTYKILHGGKFTAIGMAGKLTLQPSFCVVRHSIMQGSDLGLTYYVHPRDVARLLPDLDKGDRDMSRDMWLVLTATRCFKSRHAGKTRYDMARDECEGLLRYFPDPVAWAVARDELIKLGYLAQSYAITVHGRNACERYFSVRSVLSEIAVAA